MTYDREIFDIHLHLGDILFDRGGDIIHDSEAPSDQAIDTLAVFERFDYPQWSLLWRLFERKQFGYPLSKGILKSGIRRNFSASLPNLKRNLEQYNVVVCAVMPVYPNVTFEDLHQAHRVESCLKPFTGIDFDRLDQCENQLAEDVARGAAGLKIHPILQKVALNDPRVFFAMEMFAPYKKPVLFHSGVSEYYVETKDSGKQIPAFGRIEDAVPLVRAFPDVKFIAGHAGLDEIGDVIELLSPFPNVHVDISFQTAANVTKLLDTFGPERVCYGSDWPWGRMDTAIRAVEQATKHDPAVAYRLFYENAAELVNLGSAKTKSSKQKGQTGPLRPAFNI